MKRVTTLLAAFAATLIAMPAQAQVNATPNSDAEALILKPLTLVKIADLHFGTIVPSAVSGTVNVPANGNPATTSGGVMLVTSDPTVRARFAGAGTAGQRVLIDLADTPFTLSNLAGDTVTVQALTLDGSAAPTIGATRAFFFHVGGVLQINANQPEGLYSAEFDVTVEYL